MNKQFLILILFFSHITLLAQIPSYNVTLNNNPYDANIFFMTGGSQLKPVTITDKNGSTIFWDNWGLKGWDFKLNENRKITFFDRVSKGWYVMDSLQNIVDSVYCKNGYIADNHDFIALPNGNYILFAYDPQPYAMDTIVAGGSPNAIVEGLIIQELDSNHNLLFEWSSWDHFHVTDNVHLNLTNNNINFIHANAIDIDFDGNLLISSRNLDEITKIHRTTGEIIWRWGGSQNQFNFVNDYPFTHQHTIRKTGINRYLLYDNGNFSSNYTGNANVSRAVEYELDTINMTATKIWEFVHPNSLYTPSTGGVQRLPNGNTLICFGNLQAFGSGSIVTEVDTNNNIVFQMEFVNGQNLYRAHKFDWNFFTPVIGCTDSSACNYDPLSNVDDGSCFYQISIYDTLSSSSSINWFNNTITLSGDYSHIASTGYCDTIYNLNFTLISTTSTNNLDEQESLKMDIDILGRNSKSLITFIKGKSKLEKKIQIKK